MGGTTGITLSRLEYDILWEHFGLGPLPVVLDFTGHGRTEAERDTLRATAWDALTARGLGDPRAPDERLERWLPRLATPVWEVDARLHLSHSAPRTSALIAAQRKSATVAVLAGDTVTLRSVPTDQMTRAAVGLLPDHPAGTGTSITLPASTLDTAAAKAGSDPAVFQRALVTGGLGRAEARKTAEVLGAIQRVGQFGAAYTPPGQVRQRAGHAVGVYDSPAGRYLVTRKKDWVTLAAGTDAALIRQLDELLSQLDRRIP